MVARREPQWLEMITRDLNRARVIDSFVMAASQPSTLVEDISD